MSKNLVLDVANVLDISEHRVFELAYYDWFILVEYGTQQGVIEYEFNQYMSGSTRAPYWVHKFCNNVLDQVHDDTLNPAEFGVYKKELTPAEKNYGYEVLGWVAFWSLLVAAGATLAVKHATLTCMTLLCY